MSTHSMFLWRNKKNNNTFWWKKVPYLELWNLSRREYLFHTVFPLTIWDTLTPYYTCPKV